MIYNTYFIYFNRYTYYLFNKAQIINGGPHSNNSEKLEKRKIKMFTTEEFLVLENAFAENQFLTREKYLHLSEILHINTNRIKHWFQNRRTKEKNSARNIAGEYTKT